MKTFVPAGRLVAVFIDDGQGRRVVLGEATERVIDRPLIAATHKGEVRALVNALRGLLDELPDAPGGPGK